MQIHKTWCYVGLALPWASFPLFALGGWGWGGLMCPEACLL